MPRITQFEASPYITPNAWRSTYEISVTFFLIMMGLWGIHHAVSTNAWMFYGLILPVGLLNTRLFVLMHDLTHRCLFRTGWLNDAVGSVLGMWVLTPFFLWRKTHLIHHQEGGNSDKRPWVGDINMRTIQEYEALSPYRKFKYRLYRNPFIMFCLGSIYVFMIDQRRNKKSTPMHPVFGRKEYWSVLMTNIGIATLHGSLIYAFGWKFYLLGMLIPLWIGGIVGIYSFYVQHNFRNKYCVPASEWSMVDSAIKGSSFHDIPKLFMWFTANIGYHHVHTLSTRIPFYRLPSCHHENVALFEKAPRVRINDFFEVCSLKLFDENLGRMISWKEYQTQQKI